MSDMENKDLQTNRETEVPIESQEPMIPNHKNNNPIEKLKEIFSDKKRRKKFLIICGSVLVGICVVLLVIFGIKKKQEADALALQLQMEEQAKKEQEEKEIQYSRIMHSGLYPEGVTISGIQVAGLNLPEAEKAIEDFVDSKVVTGTVRLTYGDKDFTINLADYVKITNDSKSVLNDAMKAGQDEDMDTAIAKTEDLKVNGKDFPITFDYDYTDIRYAVKEIAEQIDRPMVNASFTNIDKENHTAETTDSIVGLTVDQESLISLITEAAKANNLADVITIPVTEIQPTVNKSDFVTITVEAETSMKGSNENRKFNIKKGCDIINGFLMIPGEVFSMNEQLGTRDVKEGWKEANAYVSGATDLQAGGGVCQISTTLYNNAVKADLEIVERTQHSMPVHYVRMGLDATINSINFIIDFKFQNNTDSDIVIFAWTEGNALHTKIIRSKFDTDEYDEIRLTSEKLQDLQPEGEAKVELDNTLNPGEQVTVVERRVGSIWQSYKNFYKSNKLVRTEKLARSTYKAFAGSYKVGPAITLNGSSSSSSSSSNSSSSGFIDFLE